MSEPSLIKTIRSGQWLNPKVAYVLSLFLALAMLYWLLTRFPVNFDTDFISFYAAALEVARGTPAAAYDPIAHHLTQTLGTGCCSLRWYAFYYPPVMLLLVWPLALLPFKLAFFAWVGTQLLLFIAALRDLLQSRLSVIPFLVFPAVFISLEMGQNALLTAALFAGASAALQKQRPWLAGILFGCLIYKPHFGILLPFAFIAGREWKVFFGAALSTGVLIMTSALIFGIDTWLSYLSHASTTAVNSFSTQDVAYAYLVSPYAAIRLLGWDDTTARLIQLACTVLVIALVCIVWRRSQSVPVRSAILIAGTILATPVILFYDLLMTVVVIAWLAIDAQQRGWRPWEKVILCTLYILAFLAPWGSEATGLPYGLLCAVLTMVMAWRRFTLTSESGVQVIGR